MAVLLLLFSFPLLGLVPTNLGPVKSYDESTIQMCLVAAASLP